MMAALSAEFQILLRPRKQRAPSSIVQADARSPKILGPGGLKKKIEQKLAARTYQVFFKKRKYLSP